MNNGLRILSVTPARGGSKGVPRKNLRHIGGISLTARVAKLASSLDWIDRAVLSTDDKEIAEEGVRNGFEAPFLRPDELSGDQAAAVDVWRHAWLFCEQEENTRYDVGIYIEPTCPLRSSEDVRKATDLLIDGGWDAVWTISEIDLRSHPYKQLRLNEGAVDYLDDRGASIVARQQLDMLYQRNGACYVVTRETLIEQHSLKGKRTGALVLDRELVSIDTEFDLELAEFMYNRAHARGEID